MKILYKYYISDLPIKDLRVCKHCYKMAIFDNRPSYGWNWFTLVQRTKEGAKRKLKLLSELMTKS